MRIGMFRDRVRPLSPTTADDGKGGQTVTWTTGAAVWAEVRPMTSREQIAASALQVIAPYIVTARYASTFTETKRLSVENGATLDVLGVQHDAKRRFTVMQCAEVI